jgi:hypothetical protein
MVGRRRGFPAFPLAHDGPAADASEAPSPRPTHATRKWSCTRLDSRKGETAENRERRSRPIHSARSPAGRYSAPPARWKGLCMSPGKGRVLTHARASGGSPAASFDVSTPANRVVVRRPFLDRVLDPACQTPSVAVARGDHTLGSTIDAAFSRSAEKAPRLLCNVAGRVR